MADVHSSVIRSKNMRAIRRKDTAIEKKLAAILDSIGVSYKVQVDDLVGKPDFVVDEYRAIIFTHGCFWHHHNCYFFKLPATHTNFWQNKIDKNVGRDHAVIRNLSNDGWKILIIWECALRGKFKLQNCDISERLEEWLCASDINVEIDTQGIFQIT